VGVFKDQILCLVTKERESGVWNHKMKSEKSEEFDRACGGHGNKAQPIGYEIRVEISRKVKLQFIIRAIHHHHRLPSLINNFSSSRAPNLFSHWVSNREVWMCPGGRMATLKCKNGE